MMVGGIVEAMIINRVSPLMVVRAGLNHPLDFIQSNKSKLEFPSLEFPSFKSPTFESPSFESPTFKSPTFKSPSFESPSLGSSCEPVVPFAEKPCVFFNGHQAGLTSFGPEKAGWLSCRNPEVPVLL